MAPKLMKIVEDNQTASDRKTHDNDACQPRMMHIGAPRHPDYASGLCGENPIIDPGILCQQALMESAREREMGRKTISPTRNDPT